MDNMNFSVFQEPRGVMRILHVIFSICAFSTITGYSGYLVVKNCGTGNDAKVPHTFEINYPFQLRIVEPVATNCTLKVLFDASSDSRFFVATGVLSFLYALAICLVYVKFDDIYRRNTRLPLLDFIITVFLGVLWISSSAAWANSLTGLKYATDSTNIKLDCCSSGTIHTSNFSTLNISVVFGFLNFFLWASDLWFLYKETSWFQGNQPQTTSGV